jgi:hypothetical protein
MLEDVGRGGEGISICSPDGKGSKAEGEKGNEQLERLPGQLVEAWPSSYFQACGDLIFVGLWEW